jgi:pyridoxamine 5'-phosphate oxidase-like protein
MASWSEVERQAPELAAAAKGYFDKHKHKTLATLRQDGSPRISGTEMEIADGELTFGSMWRGVKALDLLRDPRFALHSGSDEPDDGWTGDAKVAGRAEEVARTEGRSHTFRADITELVVVHMGEPSDHIVIESWHEGRGITTLRRD